MQLPNSGLRFAGGWKYLSIIFSAAGKTLAFVLLALIIIRDNFMTPTLNKQKKFSKNFCLN